MKEEVEKTLKLLQDSEYCDPNLLKDFNDAVTQYVECRTSYS